MELLESGRLLFLARPRVRPADASETYKQMHVPHSADEVARFMMLLQPVAEAGEHERPWRLLTIPRKHLPTHDDSFIQSYSSTNRLLALVSETASDLKSQRELMHDILHGFVYETMTRGQREEPPCIPIAMAYYILSKHTKKQKSLPETRLTYRIIAPSHGPDGRFGRFQAAFHLQWEASMIISVKNPEITLPNSPLTKVPQYPHELTEHFHHRLHFIPMDSIHFLDYEGTSLILIGTRQLMTELVDSATWQIWQQHCLKHVNWWLERWYAYTMYQWEKTHGQSNGPLVGDPWKAELSWQKGILWWISTFCDENVMQESEKTTPLQSPVTVKKEHPGSSSPRVRTMSNDWRWVEA